MKHRRILVMISLSLSLSSSPVVAALPDAMEYGRAFIAEGDNDGAIKSYAEALRLAPSDPVALNNMGVAKAAAGDYQSAMEFFKRAVKIAPERLDINDNLTHLLGWVKTYRNNAIPSASTAMPLIPEPPAIWPTLPSSSVASDPSRPLQPLCAKDLCK